MGPKNCLALGDNVTIDNSNFHEAFPQLHFERAVQSKNKTLNTSIVIFAKLMFEAVPLVLLTSWHTLARQEPLSWLDLEKPSEWMSNGMWKDLLAVRYNRASLLKSQIHHHDRSAMDSNPAELHRQFPQMAYEA